MAAPATDIGAIRQQAMQGPKATVVKQEGPKPIPRTVRFSLHVDNVQTGETETYNIQSTIHKDLDGMIDRASLAMAGAPLTHFLPQQAQRFLMLGRCSVQIDNLDAEKKLETDARREALADHLFDNPELLTLLHGRLAEHHRRFRFRDRPAASGEAGEGADAAKKPSVLVGGFDPPDGNSPVRR